jgi:enoyl-CoA hydratase
MSDNSPFIAEKDGYVAWLVFNRPEKRNTMTFEVFDGLIEVFTELNADPGVRVVVMKAEGKSFCTGLDLAEAASMFSPDPGADTREENRRKIMIAQESMSIIEKCRRSSVMDFFASWR